MMWMGCMNQVDIKRRSLTWYTARIIALLSWRWGRIAFLLLDSFLQQNNFTVLIFQDFFHRAFGLRRFQVSKCCSVGKTKYKKNSTRLHTAKILADYRFKSKDASDTIFFWFFCAFLKLRYARSPYPKSNTYVFGWKNCGI